MEQNEKLKSVSLLLLVHTKFRENQSVLSKIKKKQAHILTLTHAYSMVTSYFYFVPTRR